MIEKQIFETITEGFTDILVYRNKETKKGPGTKEGVPFYNPSMEMNRDISILVAQWMLNNSKDRLKLLDGLAASGIRGLRFANELDGDFEVYINDWDLESYDLIKKNVEKGGFENIKFSNYNLNTLLSENRFHYIDIDPFGSPVYFIDSAIRSIINDGVLACTATDTATLCGVYPKVCLRRYGAIPFHSVVMKEVGLRILLGFICREANKYDKGIEPLISYTTDHYFRVYVRIKNGVSRANDSLDHLSVIKSGEYIGFEKTDKDIGPLWLGRLQSKNMIGDLRSILFEKQLRTKNDLWKLLDLLEEESYSPEFFYTTDSIASYLKTSAPKMESIFENLSIMGYEISKTHFSSTGFKTNATFDVIEKVFK